MDHVFDKLGRLSSVDVRGERFAHLDYGSPGTGGPLSITYSQVGQRREISAMTYDGRGRQVGIDVIGPTGNLLASRHDVFGTDGIVRQRQHQSSVMPRPLS